MTIISLDDITLAKGGHINPEAGLCLLEAVAYVAGEPHGDHPTCTSPVLGRFGRNLNDVLPDDKRQKLRDHIPAMIGTAGDGLDEARSYIALDWLIRVYLPTFLALHEKTREHATAAQSLAPIVDMATAKAAGRVVGAASAAARAAAWDAARAAAWDFLAPTVSTLQDSAIELMPRIINPTSPDSSTTTTGEQQ